jgi:hypothetical protein
MATVFFIVLLGLASATNIRVARRAPNIGSKTTNIEMSTSSASQDLHEATTKALNDPKVQKWANTEAETATVKAEEELEARQQGLATGGATGGATSGTGGSTGSTGGTGGTGSTGSASTGSAAPIKLWLDSPKCNFNGDHHITNGCLCKIGHGGKNCEYKVLAGKQGRYIGMSECEHGQRDGSSCMCARGWSGFHCNKPTIECEHGKVRCVGVNSHCGHGDPKQCICDDLWEGKGCDVRIVSPTGATGATGVSSTGGATGSTEATGATGATGADSNAATGNAATGAATDAPTNSGNSAERLNEVAQEQRFVESKTDTSNSILRFLSAFRI